MDYVEQGVQKYQEKLKEQQIIFLQKKANELNLQLIEN